MLKWLSLITLLTVTDQVSKRIAENVLSFAEPVSAIPYFNFMLVYNKGAAFSFLSEAGGWQRWFFVILASAVCIYIFNWIRKLKPHEKMLGIALSFVLSGALGNLIDRALFGKVTDFIDFFYITSNDCFYFFFKLSNNTCHWPTFNIADILISLGATLLLIQMLRDNPDNEDDRHKIS